MSYKDLTVADIISQPECTEALEDIRKVQVWTQQINNLLVLINKTEKSIEERVNANNK